MQTQQITLQRIWQGAKDLPADGSTRCLPFIGVQAKRMPKDAIHSEYIVVDCGDYCLRRIYDGGKWSRFHTVGREIWNR